MSFSSLEVQCKDQTDPNYGQAAASYINMWISRIPESRSRLYVSLPTSKPRQGSISMHYFKMFTCSTSIPFKSVSTGTGKAGYSINAASTVQTRTGWAFIYLLVTKSSVIPGKADTGVGGYLTDTGTVITVSCQAWIYGCRKDVIIYKRAPFLPRNIGKSRDVFDICKILNNLIGILSPFWLYVR